jgi:Ca2+-binding EF-hand superfamily protein
LSRTEWDNRTAGLKDFVHAGKTMKQRDAEEKKRLEAFEMKVKQDHIEELKGGKAKSGKSNRPEFTNAANMPNYLGSARAATGRTARKKGQEVAKLFDLLDLDGDGELTRDEVVTSYEQLNMTEKEAGDFFDSLDPDRKGVLSRTEWDNRTAGLKDFVHAGRTVGSRDAEEKRRLVAFEAKMREDHIHEMKSGKAKSGVSDRPEFTAPGSMPNYLSSASGKLSPKDMKKFTHTGKGLAEREARQKAIVDEVERKAKEGDLAEKRNSNRPEFTNAANMPNYLGSARAATGRTARKKGQEVAKLFDLLDLDGDGELTRDEVVTSYEQLNMTEKEAGDFFDSLDPDRKGVLSRTEWDNRTAGLKDFVHAGKTIQVKNKNVAFQILFQSAFLTSLVVFVSFLP